MKKLIFLIAFFSCNSHKQEVKKQGEKFTCVAKTYPKEVQQKKVTNLLSAVGKNNVIYLSFYGGVVSNTRWNLNGDIVYDSAHLSQSAIDSIITNVSLRFDTLHVKITTDERLYNRTKPEYKQKVIFTVTNDWFGSGGGGVSFIGSFGLGDPAWIFTGLLNYNTYKIHEVGSHETGHTLSLYHQSVWDTACNFINEYRQGVLMGSTLNVPGGWTVGPTSDGCNVIQNDLVKMSSIVGWK